MWPPTLLPLMQTFRALPGKPRTRYSPQQLQYQHSTTNTSTWQNPGPMERKKAQLPTAQATLSGPASWLLSEAGSHPYLSPKSSPHTASLRAQVNYYIQGQLRQGSAGAVWHMACRWYSFCLFIQHRDLAIKGLQYNVQPPARSSTGLDWWPGTTVPACTPTSSPAERGSE